MLQGKKKTLSLKTAKKAGLKQICVGTGELPRQSQSEDLRLEIYGKVVKVSLTFYAVFPSKPMWVLGWYSQRD